MTDIKVTQADFSQSRNDLYWTIYTWGEGGDGRICWTGYDDDFWWHNVSVTDQARNRVGPKTGKIYRIDFQTNEVEVLPAKETA